MNFLIIFNNFSYLKKKMYLDFVFKNEKKKKVEKNVYFVIFKDNINYFFFFPLNSFDGRPRPSRTLFRAKTTPSAVFGTAVDLRDAAFEQNVIYCSRHTVLMEL